MTETLIYQICQTPTIYFIIFNGKFITPRTLVGFQNAQVSTKINVICQNRENNF